MELQIQDLVSSIRKEGVDAANEAAEAILADVYDMNPNTEIHLHYTNMTKPAYSFKLELKRSVDKVIE